ncbi:MAG: hypothetical protein HY721_23555 [Planctomycetes bacterium]|nr:hypothetical protein [Planctomycetota bacterium]
MIGVTGDARGRHENRRGARAARPDGGSGRTPKETSHERDEGDGQARAAEVLEGRGGRRGGARGARVPAGPRRELAARARDHRQRRARETDAGSRPGRLLLRASSGGALAAWARRDPAAPLVLRYRFPSPRPFRFRVSPPEGTGEVETAPGGAALTVPDGAGGRCAIATHPAGLAVASGRAGAMEVAAAAEVAVAVFPGAAPGELGPELARGPEAPAAAAIRTGVAELDDLLEASALAVEANAFASGVIVAGSDIWYKNAWIRDGTYAVLGADLAGRRDLAERFFRFWIREGGFSWGGENEAQQPAIAILGMRVHALLLPPEDARGFLREVYPYVKRYADYYAGRVEKEGMIMLARSEVFGRGLGAVQVDDPRFAATQAWIRRVLLQPDRSISRFDGDPASPHYPGGEWPVWPISSAWAAQVELLRGRLDRAWEHLVSGVARKRGADHPGALRQLPEQWRLDGRPVRTTRFLTWSHGELLTSAVFLLLGLDPEPEGADLGLRPSLPPGSSGTSIAGWPFRGWTLDVEVLRSAPGAARALVRGRRGPEGPETLRIAARGRVLELSDGARLEVAARDAAAPGPPVRFGASAERSRLAWEILLGEPPPALDAAAPEAHEELIRRAEDRFDAERLRAERARRQAELLAALGPRAATSAGPPPSEGLRVATLFTAQEMRGALASQEGRDAAVAWCRRHGVDHAFVESFRDGYQAEDATLEVVRDRFARAGIAASGCITPTGLGKPSTGWKPLSCYASAQTQARLRDVFAQAARLFDEVMIDDFLCTDCACEECLLARGEEGWPEYRMRLLREVGAKDILGAARAARPGVRVIVKYPQWYDGFHDRGYDAAGETALYPAIWVGLEGLRELARRLRGRAPIGVAAAKPPSSQPAKGEEYLFDHAGMLGLPLVPCVAIPGEAPAALITSHAARAEATAAWLRAAPGRPVLVTAAAEPHLPAGALGGRPAARLEWKSDAREVMEQSRDVLDGMRGKLLAPLGVRLSAPGRVALDLFGPAEGDPGGDAGFAALESFRDEAIEVLLELAGRRARDEGVIVLPPSRRPEVRRERRGGADAWTIPQRTLVAFRLERG